MKSKTIADEDASHKDDFFGIKDTLVVLAQLVELRFVVPAVTGSSPVDHPRLHSIYYSYGATSYSKSITQVQKSFCAGIQFLKVMSLKNKYGNTTSYSKVEIVV